MTTQLDVVFDIEECLVCDEPEINEEGKADEEDGHDEDTQGGQETHPYRYTVIITNPQVPISSSKGRRLARARARVTGWSTTNS